MQHFDTGAVRDTNDGKPRFDLISPYALERLGHHMAKGAEHYGERNREKGIPVERMYESALRHLMQYKLDPRGEDHLCAVLFNVMGIIHFQETTPILSPNQPNAQGDKEI